MFRAAYYRARDAGDETTARGLRLSMWDAVTRAAAIERHVRGLG